jgi:hypothetical protein
MKTPPLWTPSAKWWKTRAGRNSGRRQFSARAERFYSDPPRIFDSRHGCFLGEKHGIFYALLATAVRRQTGFHEGANDWRMFAFRRRELRRKFAPRETSV